MMGRTMGASLALDGEQVSWKDTVWVVGSAGVALAALTYFTGTGSLLTRALRHEYPKWHRATITAGYIGTELKEIDNTRSSVIISYDLENHTDSDYRLTDNPGLVILSRLKSDGSFSQEQPIRLSYPVFLPARQHARLAIEITQPFNWPSEGDSTYLDKMRNFVKQRLRNVGEFVLFDQTNHWQLELPSGWDQLQDSQQAGD